MLTLHVVSLSLSLCLLFFVLSHITRPDPYLTCLLTKTNNRRQLTNLFDTPTQDYTSPYLSFSLTPILFSLHLQGGRAIDSQPTITTTSTNSTITHPYLDSSCCEVLLPSLRNIIQFAPSSTNNNSNKHKHNSPLPCYPSPSKPDLKAILLPLPVQRLDLAS